MDNEDNSNLPPGTGPRPLEPWVDPTMEARLVALALGEASDFESAELEAALESQPELRAFYDRILTAHGFLVRNDGTEVAGAWKLPTDVREDLLKKFRAVDAAAEGLLEEAATVVTSKRSRSRALAPWLAVAAAIVLSLSVLTLANRQLDSAPESAVALSGGVRKGGTLEYNESESYQYDTDLWIQTEPPARGNIIDRNRDSAQAERFDIADANKPSSSRRRFLKGDQPDTSKDSYLIDLNSTVPSKQNMRVEHIPGDRFFATNGGENGTGKDAFPVTPPNFQELPKPASQPASPVAGGSDAAVVASLASPKPVDPTTGLSDPFDFEGIAGDGFGGGGVYDSAFDSSGETDHLDHGDEMAGIIVARHHTGDQKVGDQWTSGAAAGNGKMDPDADGDGFTELAELSNWEDSASAETQTLGYAGTSGASASDGKKEGASRNGLRRPGASTAQVAASAEKSPDEQGRPDQLSSPTSGEVAQIDRRYGYGRNSDFADPAPPVAEPVSESEFLSSARNLRGNDYREAGAGDGEPALRKGLSDKKDSESKPVALAKLRAVDAMISEGEELYREGKLEEAVDKLRVGLDNLPEGAAAAETRARGVALLADSTVDRAHELSTQGNFPEARKSLEAVISPDIAPDHRRAREVLGRLDDPDYYNPAVTPARAKQVAEVERLHKLAEGNSALGLYDNAEKQYNEILRVDKYDETARRGMEDLELKRQEYYKTARDHMRSKMLSDVDRLWEWDVPAASEEKKEMGEKKTALLAAQEQVQEEEKDVEERRKLSALTDLSDPVRQLSQDSEAAISGALYRATLDDEMKELKELSSNAQNSATDPVGFHTLKVSGAAEDGSRYSLLSPGLVNPAESANGTISKLESLKDQEGEGSGEGQSDTSLGTKIQGNEGSLNASKWALSTGGQQLEGREYDMAFRFKAPNKSVSESQVEFDPPGSDTPVGDSPFASGLRSGTVVDSDEELIARNYKIFGKGLDVDPRRQLGVDWSGVMDGGYDKDKLPADHHISVSNYTDTNVNFGAGFSSIEDLEGFVDTPGENEGEFRQRSTGMVTNKVEITGVNNEWGFVTLNTGRMDGVVLGGELDVKRDDGKIAALNNEGLIPSGEKVAGRRVDVKRGGKKIGELNITEVDDRMTVADIVPGSMADGVKILPGDEVDFGNVGSTLEAEPVVSEDSKGISSIADREFAHRKDRSREASDLFEKGKRLVANGNHEAAVPVLEEVLGMIPNAPMTADMLAEVQKLIETSNQRKKEVVEELNFDLETLAVDESFSTFSLSVSDVSFKLAKTALLEQNTFPEKDKIRAEEFVNAMEYGDPQPSLDEKVGCKVEQAAHPFLQQRNLMRVAMQTAAAGRDASQPLRLTILLDKSGSMEREDREESVLRTMQALAKHLGPADQVSAIAFARTPHLVADRLSGDRAQELVGLVAATPSEGGTNLESALELAESLAMRQFEDGAINRVVLITDGAANLGDADPESLMERVIEMRERGIAFDACGVGADGLNDAALEALTRKGDGRYYFLNRPEDADASFVRQLAGSLRPAAKNVKVQVKFNPNRVPRYRLLGFEKHRLKKEDFRNDKVDAAEMAAAESGNALYQFEADPQGNGDVGEVFVRFLDTSSGEMVERSWPIPYKAQAPRLEGAAPSMQLAATAGLLAEKLKGGAIADAINLPELAPTTAKLRAHYGLDERVNELIQMVEKTRALTGE